MCSDLAFRSAKLSPRCGATGRTQRKTGVTFRAVPFNEINYAVELNVRGILTSDRVCLKRSLDVSTGLQLTASGPKSERNGARALCPEIRR